MNGNEIYRYKPPISFSPATPPLTKHEDSKRNTFLLGRKFVEYTPTINQSQHNDGSDINLNVQTNWGTETKSSQISSTDGSSPRPLLPLHSRQRSAPTAMPSFVHQNNSGILGDQGGAQVESVARLVTPTHDEGKNSAYNLVIDIRLHGPELSGDDSNRMTQSLIEDNNELGVNRWPNDQLNLLQTSNGHSPRSSLEWDDNKRYILQNNLRLTQQKPLEAGAETLFSAHPSHTCSIETEELRNELQEINTKIQTLDFKEQRRLKASSENNRADTLRVIASTKNPRSNGPQSYDLLTTNWYSGPRGVHTMHLAHTADIPDLVRLLNSPNLELVANSAAKLQHLVYKNSSAKEKLQKYGAIPRLVNLLYSNYPSVCLNALYVLRNLTCGDNTGIKCELDEVGGIKALSWLIENTPPCRERNLDEDATRLLNDSFPKVNKIFDRRSEQILENAAAVLCNLTAEDHLKKVVVEQDVIPYIVYSILQVSIARIECDENFTLPYTSLLFTGALLSNSVAIIRNVSSCDDIETRERVRQCSALFSCLTSLLSFAVQQRCPDLICVEHCICAIRNLCFEPSTNGGRSSIHRAETVGSTTTIEKKPQSLRRLRNSMSRSRKNKENNEQSATCPLDTSSSDLYDVLSQPKTVKSYLDLLQSSANPCVLEASAGTLQHLASLDSLIGVSVRHSVRALQGLPILTELLRAPVMRVATAAAGALRNLVMDEANQCLIAKHGMGQVLAALDQCIADYTQLSQHVKSWEWQKPYNTRNSSSTMPGMNAQTKVKAIDYFKVATALIQLCSGIIRDEVKIARRFITMGGFERCQELLDLAGGQSMSGRASIKVECTENQLTQSIHQLLHRLWKFTDLRPIYKLAGWNEQHFGVKKRSSRLSKLVHRRSTKSNNVKSDTSPISDKQTHCDIERWRYSTGDRSSSKMVNEPKLRQKNNPIRRYNSLSDSDYRPTSVHNDRYYFKSSKNASQPQCLDDFQSWKMNETSHNKFRYTINDFDLGELQA